MINETSRNSLKEKPCFFNETVKYFENKHDMYNFLIDRYGIFPKGKHKIYIDDLNGKPKEVGFLHSYWNRDCFHDSKAWYQTDWVEVCEMTEKNVDLIKFNRRVKNNKIVGCK